MAPVIMSSSGELTEGQNDENSFHGETETDDVTCACQDKETKTSTENSATNRNVSDNEDNNDVNECANSEASTDKGQDSGVVEVEKEIDIDVAPDGGWGWFIVVGALLLRTVIGNYHSVLYA